MDIFSVFTLCGGLAFFLSGMTTTLISFGSVILTLIGLPVYAIKSKEKARLAESESVHAVSTQGAHSRKTAKEG